MADAKGRKLWNKATKGLDSDDRYDLFQSEIYDFKEATGETNSIFLATMDSIFLAHDEYAVVTETWSLSREPNRVALDKVIDFAQQVWRNNARDFRLIELK